MVFDLLTAVMAGNPREALQITDRAYERGADLGIVLQDLLELVHTLTRLKSIPDLRDSGELPEAERTRGSELAERLSVPSLARAWQMLLKGVGEVETAPDRRAAAEMVLIRLCYLSEQPTPGDLVRRLSATSATVATTPASPLPSPLPTPGVRAVAGAAAPAVAAAATAFVMSAKSSIPAPPPLTPRITLKANFSASAFV